MTLLLIALAAVVTAGVLVWLLRERPAQWPPPSTRTEECEVCMAVVPIADAHMLSASWPDPETGGGTAISAFYCAEHCPGGCKRGCCEHRTVQVDAETVMVNGSPLRKIYTARCTDCGRAVVATPEMVATMENA